MDNEDIIQVTKGITIIQPFASLILAGIKTVENRSWPCKNPGYYALHAGKTKCSRKEIDRLKKIPSLAYFVQDMKDIPVGAIIGIVKFGVIEPSSDVDDFWKMNDGFWWHIDEVIKLDKPIERKGQLGLWNLTKEESSILTKAVKKHNNKK